MRRSGSPADAGPGRGPPRDAADRPCRLEAWDRDLAAAEAQLSAADGQDISDALMRFEGITERLRGLEALLSERRSPLAARSQRRNGRGCGGHAGGRIESPGKENCVEVEDSAALLNWSLRCSWPWPVLKRSWSSSACRSTSNGVIKSVPDPESDAPRIKGEIRILEASIHRDQDESDRLGQNLGRPWKERRQELVEELDRCWAEAKDAEIARPDRGSRSKKLPSVR